jgi:hypothetical protein
MMLLFALSVVVGMFAVVVRNTTIRNLQTENRYLRERVATLRRSVDRCPSHE